MKKERTISATVKARKELRLHWEDTNLSMSGLIKYMTGSGKKLVIENLDAIEKVKGENARVTFARAASVKNICAALTAKDVQAKKDGKKRFFMTVRCPITETQIKREKFSLSMMMVAINQMSADQVQAVKVATDAAKNALKGQKTTPKVVPAK